MSNLKTLEQANMFSFQQIRKLKKEAERTNQATDFTLSAYKGFKIVQALPNCPCRYLLDRCPVIIKINGINYYRLPVAITTEQINTQTLILSNNTIQHVKKVFIPLNSNIKIIKQVKHEHTYNEQQPPKPKEITLTQQIAEVLTTGAELTAVYETNNNIFTFPRFEFTELSTYFNNAETFRAFCLLMHVAYRTTQFTELDTVTIQATTLYKLLPKGFPVKSQMNKLKTLPIPLITNYKCINNHYIIAYNREFFNSFTQYSKINLNIFKLLNPQFLTGHAWSFLMYLFNVSATKAKTAEILHNLKNIMELSNISLKQGKDTALQRINRYISLLGEIGIIKNPFTLLTPHLKSTAPPTNELCQKLQINKDILLNPIILKPNNRDRFNNFINACKNIK